MSFSCVTSRWQQQSAVRLPQLSVYSLLDLNQQQVSSRTNFKVFYGGTVF